MKDSQLHLLYFSYEKFEENRDIFEKKSSAAWQQREAKVEKRNFISMKGYSDLSDKYTSSKLSDFLTEIHSLYSIMKSRGQIGRFFFVSRHEMF